MPPLIDYAGSVVDPVGVEKHSLGCYFEDNEAAAMAWFTGDKDLVPKDFTKKVVKYDSSTGAITIIAERVVTRFLPGPIQMTARTKKLLERWVRLERCAVSEAILKGSTNEQVDFVQLDDEDISYTPQSRDKRTVEVLGYDDKYGTKGRQTAKPGRLVRKMIQEAWLKDLTDKQIEDFANRVKAAKALATPTIHLVQGEAIREWYLHTNYSGHAGTARSSCMRYEKCQPWLDLYVENSTVSMAILLDEDGLLLGRAVVWDMFTEDGEPLPTKFMDRIYANDANRRLFQLWARQQGYHIKAPNGEGGTLSVLPPDKELDSYAEGMTVFCKLDKADFRPQYGERGYPYCDNMRYVDLENRIIHNNRTYPHTVETTYTEGQYVNIRPGDREFPRWFTGNPPPVECPHCHRQTREDYLRHIEDWTGCNDCFDTVWFSDWLTGEYVRIADKVEVRIRGYMRAVTKASMEQYAFECPCCHSTYRKSDGSMVAVDGNEQYEMWCYGCADSKCRHCYNCGKYYPLRVTHVCSAPTWDDDDEDEDVINGDGYDNEEDD